MAPVGQICLAAQGIGPPEAPHAAHEGNRTRALTHEGIAFFHTFGDPERDCGVLQEWLHAGMDIQEVLLLVGRFILIGLAISFPGPGRIGSDLPATLDAFDIPERDTERGSELGLRGRAPYGTELLVGGQRAVAALGSQVGGNGGSSEHHDMGGGQCIGHGHLQCAWTKKHLQRVEGVKTAQRARLEVLAGSEPCCAV